MSHTFAPKKLVLISSCSRSGTIDDPRVWTKNFCPTVRVVQVLSVLTKVPTASPPLTPCLLLAMQCGTLTPQCPVLHLRTMAQQWRSFLQPDSDSRLPHSQNSSSQPDCEKMGHEELVRCSAKFSIDQQLPTRCTLGLPSRTVRPRPVQAAGSSTRVLTQSHFC